VPGTGSISNSQCSVNLQTATVSASGNDLILNLPITFAAQYGGVKNVYMLATGSTVNSGWQTLGTWTVPNTQAVSTVSVTPASGTGHQQTFTLQYSDTSGASDLSSVWAVFTAVLGSQNSCPLYFSASTNVLTLYSDNNGSSTSGTLGSAGILSNSQCSVNLQASTVNRVGFDLTLTLPMTFTTQYAGVKNVYMYAAGSATVSDWHALGTWTVQ
jgi:hypothetical protein